MKDKYFTPEIEDLRIGYECEICDSTAYDPDTWRKVKFVYKNTENSVYSDELTEEIHMFDDGASDIRVPYLTKEQIESEGWEFTGKGIDLWFKKEGIILRDDGHHFTKIVFHYGIHDHRLTVNMHFVGGNEEKFFEGECKDINTFRYICKLLKIN